MDRGRSTQVIFLVWALLFCPIAGLSLGVMRDSWALLVGVPVGLALVGGLALRRPKLEVAIVGFLSAGASLLALVVFVWLLFSTNDFR